MDVADVLDEGRAGAAVDLKGAVAVAQKLYDTLYGIQTGKVEDDMGWTYKLFDLK